MYILLWRLFRFLFRCICTWCTLFIMEMLWFWEYSDGVYILILVCINIMWEICTFYYLDFWRRPMISVMDGSIMTRIFEIFILKMRVITFFENTDQWRHGYLSEPRSTYPPPSLQVYVLELPKGSLVLDVHTLTSTKMIGNHQVICIYVAAPSWHHATKSFPFTRNGVTH